VRRYESLFDSFPCCEIYFLSVGKEPFTFRSFTPKMYFGFGTITGKRRLDPFSFYQRQRPFLYSLSSEISTPRRTGGAQGDESAPSREDLSVASTHSRPTLRPLCSRASRIHGVSQESTCLPPCRKREKGAQVA